MSGEEIATFRRGLGGAPWLPQLGTLLVSTVDSTNRLARRLLDLLEAEGERPLDFVVLALEQSAGRGRGARMWTSPAGGGLYATRALLLPDPSAAALLPLRVPTALCDALNRLLDGRCRVKWPNDLLVDGKKLGGVLIELVGRGSAGTVALVGFGVNHSRPAPASELPAATSLRQELPDAPPLPAFALGLVSAVEEELGRGRACAESVARFAERLVHRAGDRLRVRCGEEEIDGSFAGVDERGFLRLDTAGGMRLLPAGEVIS